MRDNDRISGYQVMVFVFNALLGAGIISLPSTAAQYAGNDGWLLVLVSGFIDILLLLFICFAGSKCRERGLFKTLSRAFGKIPSAILLLPFIVYIIVLTGMESRMFSESVKIYLLHRTPIEFIVIPMILLAVVLARAGIEPICRFFEIVFPLTAVLIFLCMLIASRDLDWSNLRPFFSASPSEFLKGLANTTFAFEGFQLLLIIYPFIRKPKGTVKYSIIGLLFILATNVIATLMCLAKFGAVETSRMFYPIISLIKVSEIPGAFVERTEAFILAIWLVCVFTTIVAFLYSLSVLCSDILNQSEGRHVVPLALPLIYIISLYGENVAEIGFLTRMNSLYMGTYVTLILPLIVLLAWLLKGKGVKKHEG
jgi:spore germination protein (amino acid permease)